MSKKLELEYLDINGKSSKIILDDPKEGMQAAEVKTAMQEILDAKVILSAKGAELASIKSARIVDRQVQEFNME